MGFRFRIHRKDLPGKPDLVFAGRKKVIFVHGCFWHGHICKEKKMPKSRTSFWSKKIADNRIRDAKNELLLMADGWKILVIWECETKNLELLALKIRMFLQDN
jgi:DNA mismatch endonuclease (patch repair protein)